MKYTKFGNELQLGKNLDTLRKLDYAFEKLHGISVIDYCFTIASKENKRTAKSLGRHSLKTCEICGQDLFHTHAEKGELVITEKRHLIAIDHKGERHNTCYGLNYCLKNEEIYEDYEVLDNKEKLLSEKDVPAVSDFLKIGQSDIKTDSDAQAYRDMQTDYEEKVVPFIKKWRLKDLNEITFTEFLADLKPVKDHLVWYGDEEFGYEPEKMNRAQANFLDFVFQSVGITL